MIQDDMIQLMTEKNCKSESQFIRIVFIYLKELLRLL